MQATSPVSFASIDPGDTKTVTYSVTPPADDNGSDGLIVTVSYSAGSGTAPSASAEQWMHVQKPLPLPPGATDLALTATPSASYASPWTTITAINKRIYPIQSSDDNDLTPYWGTWPMAGSQYVPWGKRRLRAGPSARTRAGRTVRDARGQACRRMRRPEIRMGLIWIKWSRRPPGHASRPNA